jgi:hypothetical protein
MPLELLGDLDDDLDELMGDDELEGDFYGNELMGDDDDDDDDDVELMGARRRRRRRHARGRRRLRRRHYSRERGLVLGFGTQTIAANTTVDFTANPQVPFRPKRMIVQATSVAQLDVEDIKVGKNSMLTSAQAFPASGFAAGTFDQAIKFDTAVPGIEVTVTCTDQSGAANVTNVGMFGVAAER